jgi:hypothetical protein
MSVKVAAPPGRTPMVDRQSEGSRMRTLRVLAMRSSLACCLLAMGSASVTPLLLGQTAASDSAAIHEQSRRFSAAYVRGDAAAMTELYTSDAVIFPERSAAITGAEAIRRYWTLPAGRRIPGMWSRQPTSPWTAGMRTITAPSRSPESGTANHGAPPEASTSWCGGVREIAGASISTCGTAGPRLDSGETPYRCPGLMPLEGEQTGVVSARTA